MECLTIIKELGIGALGSIIASVVISCFLSRYEIEFESKVKCRLDIILNYVWMIRNRYGFEEDYDLIVHCAEEIQKQIIEIANHIKPLNRMNKKDIRVFYTLLYDLQRRCERICFQTIGYRGHDEIRARINRIEKEHFTNDEEFIPEIEVEWMKKIIDGDSPKYTDGIIECNSYKFKEDEIYIKKNGITKSEFQRIVKDCHE